uniref:Uncharacterized protein n=1 Tax=viral metagenome TaxID=1070528 RepID=A0A6C0CIH1_9ZZZZ
MASKVILMNAFFDQFISFVSELSQMYPDDSDLSLAKTTLHLMRTTQPKLVINYVKDNVLKFEDKIMNKDESFFMSYDYNEYSTDVDMNVFQKLKDYNAQLSPASKENIWKYVQNITRLCKAIIQHSESS